jgi:hypothetical protein
MESEPAREAEEEEIDVIWDENGTARYRILKDTRIVDFDGHNIAWLDDHGNVIDYEGRHLGFYENGVMRDAEGMVIGLGQDPAGPHPILPSKGLIPSATKAESAPKKPKPKKILKRPPDSLLWSKKMLEEL